MTESLHTRSRAYATLITRASYLAGVVIFAYTLKKRGSKYPLVVLYTPDLAAHAVRALELESARSNSNIILHKCDYLRPPSTVEVTLIAKRFEDTWTKLRVFQLTDWDEVCYLDADIAAFKNPDDIFTHIEELPSDWIAANPECVCNCDDPWAPADHTPEHCAHSPAPTSLSGKSPPRTHQLLNGGMFIFKPSEKLWLDMMTVFEGSPDLLSTFMFPDQDFLGHFFRGKWKTVGWQYNAYKTMRYWHTNLWKDGDVVCLHYIVDKPWAARIAEDGVAGYKGRDGVTHRWWWREYDFWHEERLSEGEKVAEIVSLVSKGVAPLRHQASGQVWESLNDPDMKAIGTNVQGLANNLKAKTEEVVGTA